MYHNYRAIVPPEHWDNVLYKEPSKEILELVKSEKKDRQVFRGGLNEKKLDVQRKESIMAKIESVAYGDVKKGEHDV